ncbi:tyrosine--tRNA ligase [Neolewinella antarctica]|uniref:Tyrosine--tRNA ligase n=1 Tax=Neolewinella antarctica TaxID=442734 RepID=A0ABX0XCE7_9BACT|nr:tyrosine--tRNA ligase [Neolewinella antarctica]NJC26949.1 tyrosyl-tRNA synthetase [Neolewinella antarctica]
MDFIAELEWRGMLHQLTPGIREHLNAAPRKAYIGFDPTANSLTIGNYVQVMILTLWARAGHHPVILFGGATGRIGDPSGKDKERQLKTYEELDANLESQKAQMMELIGVGLRGVPTKYGTGAREVGEEHSFSVVNNYEFYEHMNVLDFLRNVGKTLTISYMMSKDSVQSRLDTGMSFTEFSYQLLQGYDFQKLYEDYGVTVQMGGSDQWGNITAGTEFVRRNAEGKAYAVTTPLLTKADGTKFGKSEKGNIWLDPEMTGPYDFYQFWVRSNDADIPTYLKTFSLRTKEEILADVATVEAHGPDNNLFKQVNAIKHALAAELTERIHGAEGITTAKRVTDIFYGRGTTPEDLQSLTAKTIEGLRGEIPDFVVDRAALAASPTLIDLLSDTTVTSSKSEARRAIENNAISINKVKMTDVEAEVNTGDLLHDRFILIENGKKRRYLLVIE